MLLDDHAAGSGARREEHSWQPCWGEHAPLDAVEVGGVELLLLLLLDLLLQLLLLQHLHILWLGVLSADGHAHHLLLQRELLSRQLLCLQWQGRTTLRTHPQAKKG